MRGFLFALSGMIGLLLVNHPLFSLLFLLLLLFLLVRTKQYQLFLILCVILSIFSFRAFLFEKMNVSTLRGNEQTIVGKISNIPFIDGNFVTFAIKLSSNEFVKAEYRVKTYVEKPTFEKLKPGMTCLFSGKLEQPINSQNPGSLDYKKFLKQQQIHWIFKLDKLSNCSNESLSIFDRIKQYRQKGLQAIEERFPHSSAGVVQALIFGERNEMDHDVVEAYQILGLIHVLVVSGLHVGITLAILYYILLRIGIVRENVYILLLLFLPIYVLLTGAAPSVLRAAIMAGAVLIGRLFKKKLHPLECISYAFLLLIFYNPYFLFHIGFQLSFLISFALIVSSHLIMKHFSHSISRIVVVSAVADIVSTPLIMFYFHHISTFSLPVNIVFVPLFSLIVLPLSFISFFITLIFPPFAAPIHSVCETIVMFIHTSLLNIEKLSFSSIAVGKSSPVYIVLYYVAIFYFFIQIEREKKLRVSSFRHFLPFVLLVILQFSYPYVNPYGKVTLINVGQGDSILIELPFRRAVYLIDAGGSLRFEQEEWQKRNKIFDVGEDIVVPVLKAEGIRKINKMILTHGDEDHIGGAKAILQSVRVNEVIYGKSTRYEENEKQLLQYIRDKKVKLMFVERGMKWKEGKFIFHILAPIGNEKEKNDRSIVIYTTLGREKWLFMGDAEKDSELNLLKRYPHIHADVLKVGHHGSNTSTTENLLETVKPKVALISVGRNNTYGHPHHDVISRLNSRKIKIFRTDIDGAVQYRFTDSKGYFLQKQKTASQ